MKAEKEAGKRLERIRQAVSGQAKKLFEKGKKCDQCFTLATVAEKIGFPGSSEVKVSACNVGDQGSIPELGRSSGEGNSNPLQYSCLENPMDGGAQQATVHGVAKSRTRLSDFTSLHSNKELLQYTEHSHSYLIQ